RDHRGHVPRLRSASGLRPTPARERHLAAADRTAGVLRVRAIHQDVPFTTTVTAAIGREIQDLAHWLDLDLTLPGRAPTPAAGNSCGKSGPEFPRKLLASNAFSTPTAVTTTSAPPRGDGRRVRRRQ